MSGTVFISALGSLEGRVTLDQLTRKQTVLIALGAQKEVNWDEKGS